MSYREHQRLKAYFYQPWMLLAIEQTEEESIMVHKLILSPAFLLSESGRRETPVLLLCADVMRYSIFLKRLIGLWDYIDVNQTLLDS